MNGTTAKLSTIETAGDTFTQPLSPLSLLYSNASRAIEGPYSMTISMYKASVPVFLQFLTSLSAVLDKAAAYAEAKKVEPAVLLHTPPTPHQFPPVRPGARGDPPRD